MGPKKRKGAQAQEEDGGRGKRTKKPNTKFALIESDGEEDVGIVAQAKKKNSPDKKGAKKNAKQDSILHPDACLVCRELKSKEDKQNKMIGCDKCDKWFHWSCVRMTKKTQPKKNADWFCEKCKVQDSNGSSRKAEEGPKQSTWQTPAQRKVYDGPPTVNSGKAKEYSIGPPDTSSKKNGRKPAAKKGPANDLENNTFAATNTPSKAALREFLGGEETNEESTPASTEDTDDEAPPSPGIIGESIKHSLTSPKSKDRTTTIDEAPLPPGMIGECAARRQPSPKGKLNTSLRKPNVKSPGFKSTLVPVITTESRKSSSDDPYSILDNDIALETASDLPASQILEALPNPILSTKTAPAIICTERDPRSAILGGLNVASMASTQITPSTTRRESTSGDTIAADLSISISSSQSRTNGSKSTSAHVIQSGIPLSTSSSQSPINGREQTSEPHSLLGLPLSISKPQNSLVGLPISIVKSPAAAPAPVHEFLANLPISSNHPHLQSPPSPNKPYEAESSKGSKIVQVPQSIPPACSSNPNIPITRPRFLVTGPRQPLVRPGVHVLRPGQQVVRIRMAGTRPDLQGTRANFQGGRPSLPGTRPRMVIIRTSGPVNRANLPVAGANVQGANPGLPILRPGLQLFRPNLTSVRIIRPTAVPIPAPPASNLTQVEDEVMVMDKALDDIPRDLVKLIKVHEPKGLEDKDSDSDGRKTAEDDFMGMFDDETRKLAESFDMFDAAHQSDTNSLKSDEEKEAVRVQVQSPLAAAQSSQVTSPEGPVAEPESPGTPGTPRLMICTPGGSTPSLGARHLLPVRPSLGASPTLGTPRLPGQMVRLRGMRTRGGVMVRMRGGPGMRPRMPIRLLSPRAQRPGLAPRMRGAPGMRPGAPGIRLGAPGMRPRPPLRLAMPGSVGTRPGMSPRDVGPRTNLGPRPPAPVKEAPAQAAEDEILLTKDTTPVHPKKEAAELIELDDHDSPPQKPRSKAMDRLSHLGISVSRKRGEGSSHRTLPTVVAQSPSVSRPAAKKKVELELSEEQIQALKALGMM